VAGATALWGSVVMVRLRATDRVRSDVDGPA